LLIFAEKALPLGQRFSSGLGLALITVGLAVAGGVVPLSWIAT
jgi:hypothetical protein